MRLLLIVLFLGSFSLYGQKVMGTSVQEWLGGPCCLSGIDYNVYLKVEKSDTVRAIEFQTKRSKEMNTRVVRINDTLIRVHGMANNPNQDYREEQKNDLPFDGEGRIIILFNGEEKTIEIEKFEVLFPMAQP